MNKEDYNKFYIQGSDHYLIPRDIFEELFDEMSNWRDESKQLKEVIEEVRECIEKNISFCGNDSQNAYEVCAIRIASDKKLLQILDTATKENK